MSRYNIKELTPNVIFQANKIFVRNDWAAIDVDATATGADSSTFKITDAKLYVPIVSLSAEGNAKLSKLLGEGFKRPVYWNKYKVIDNTVVEIAANTAEEHIRELLDQVCIDSFNKYFLPRLKLKITISKLMEKTFMVSQLLTHLSNTMKLSFRETKSFRF